MCIITRALIFRLSILLTIWSLSNGLEQEIHGPCEGKSLEPRTVQHGHFRILYNHIPMNSSVNCLETVTFTTHADVKDLDHLEPLLERWRAPVSLAVYALGSDYRLALKSIKWFWNCGSPLVKEFVTFHLYFDTSLYHPRSLIGKEYMDKISVDCKKPRLSRDYSPPYMRSIKLPYPINVGRNIAREAALTHYVLAGDIEFYPTPELPSKFLTMISESNSGFSDKYPKRVFVLPVFQVTEDSSLPLNKTALITMLNETGTAKPSDQSSAGDSDEISFYSRWQNVPETDGLNVTFSFKRNSVHRYWKPVFIGTNEEPIYDELLTFEGDTDKKMPAYMLCAHEYDFLVLDNAFLVHRPRPRYIRRQRAGNIFLKADDDMRNKIMGFIHKSPLYRSSTPTYQCTSPNGPCKGKGLEPRVEKRSDFTVFYNFSPMNSSVNCLDTVTFTTSADLQSLDNLQPLLERWRAPISLAVYAPGWDFYLTLMSIKWLKNCGSPLVQKFVTFHLYSDDAYAPTEWESSEEFLDILSIDCRVGAPWKNQNNTSFRKKHQLPYPINFGRNIARESAPTHYVLAGDIELRPTPDLPSKFLEMIRKTNSSFFEKYDKFVFALPVFEVANTSQDNLPLNKTALITMLKETETAIPANKSYDRWLDLQESTGLHVSYSFKRTSEHQNWQPVFIGTNEDPLYDETITLEDLNNQKIPASMSCARDYDFLMLDNAFLLRRSNVEFSEESGSKAAGITEDNDDRKNEISKEVESADDEVNTCKSSGPCAGKTLEARVEQRGNFTVHYNYVPMDAAVDCMETVTLVIHSDFQYLDNMEPQLRRWRAPISLGVYAPGSDFEPSVEAIKYLRNCGSPLIRRFVTFHLYYDTDHKPSEIPQSEEVSKTMTYNCSLGAPWNNSKYTSETYRKKNKLLYPINAGRNIARLAALTHYVLENDNELYPTPNLASKFMKMIRENPYFPPRSVFVLPIFEVTKDAVPPLNKTELVNMLTTTAAAVPFHQFWCSECHTIPEYYRWLQMPETDGLHAPYSSKRRGRYASWEPVFIGTNEEPIHDERLSWEGKSDRKMQAWILCALDYNFFILDNAFLVHRPGVKFVGGNRAQPKIVTDTNNFIRNVILPEYRNLYGPSRFFEDISESELNCAISPSSLLVTFKIFTEEEQDRIALSRSISEIFSKKLINSLKM